LTACARLAGDRQDMSLAGKVMTVVRAVTLAAEPAGGIRDNHHTARHFAEIIGMVPSAATTIGDMDLVAQWAAVRFNPGGVALALDRGAMHKFVASSDRNDWDKAVRLLHHCTAVRWEARTPGTETLEPLPVIEDYWLDEFLKHHAVRLGQKLPAEVAAILEQCVREVFGQSGRAMWSYVFRPAVEDHDQNHSWRGPENSLVESLRDVIVAWSDADTSQAKAYVERLLHSDVEMLRRIGIHVLNERWSALSGLYISIVTPSLFNPSHIHELHLLLRRRFDEFSDDEKTATLAAIRDIAPAPEEDTAERIQLRWLSALRDSTYQPASDWLSQLQAATGFTIPSHPDFNTFSRSTVGPGPTPYQPAELIAFTEASELAPRLNAFVPTRAWYGPTVDGLVEALEQAVAAAPASFLRALPTFLDAASPYQHAVIQGFKRLWDSAAEAPSFTWDEGWPELISFFERLVAQPGVSEREDYPGSYIASGMADFLKAGTRADEHSYPASLLPRAWSLIQVLLKKARPADRPDEDDPMFQAINSPKGKALEALFGHALRSCRVADKDSGSHDAAWAQMQPVFDAELAKCDDANFEFATLAAAYLANLAYMSSHWLHSNVTRIFPDNRPGNLGCALGGLAYSTPSRPIYELLRDAGVIDRALRHGVKARDARQKLVERVVLGYLWDEETLDSPRFSYIFAHGLVDDLEMGALFFWSVRGQHLTDAQVTKVIDYWERVVEWVQSQSSPPVKLLGSLGRLAWAINEIDTRSRKLLLAVAPHMHRNFSVFEFLEDLTRLVEVSPSGVGEVLTKVIDASGDIYDYKDRLKLLIKRLAELGQRQVAIDCCNKMITVTGMDQLFRTLTA